jgi:hypothetical protein
MKFNPFAVISLTLVTSMVFILSGCSGPAVKWKTIPISKQTYKPNVNVYVENSGSMCGYMCNGSELKDALYDYVSDLSQYAQSVNLNYINNQIIHQNTDIKSYIDKMTPRGILGVGGNVAHSEIANMLQMILRKSDDNTVSVFVSDCILDVPAGDATKFFINNKLNIKNALNQYMAKHKDFAVEVLRMKSKFSGWYYSSKGKQLLNNMERPYYIIIMGNRHILAYLNKSVDLFSIEHGVANYCAFTTSMNVPFEITNNFGVGSKKGVIKLHGSHDGKYTFKANVELGLSLQQLDYLQKNGLVSNESSIKIASVEKSKDKSAYSHIVTFDVIGGFKPSSVVISASQTQEPAWLTDVNDDNGIDVSKDKTTGIKYIINGIAEAFKDKSTCQFNFKLIK